MNTPIKIHVDPGYKALGIEHIVYAELHGINNQITDTITINQISHLAEKALQKALLTDTNELQNNEILEGYRQMTIAVGRSLKKFPPSAQALINTIQRTRTFPRINPFVDIYNTAVSSSMLSIGAHDLDKIQGDIHFRFSSGEEPFVPIGSTIASQKLTIKNDIVYADDKNILAWLNTRDSELAKITPETISAILMIQGNPKTTLEYRLEALEKLCQQLTQICGGKYEVRYISVP